SGCLSVRLHNKECTLCSLVATALLRSLQCTIRVHSTDCLILRTTTATARMLQLNRAMMLHLFLMCLTDCNLCRLHQLREGMRLSLMRPLHRPSHQMRGCRPIYRNNGSSCSGLAWLWLFFCLFWLLLLPMDT